MLGRTAVGDVRMASSFREITAPNVWLRPVRGTSHVLDESCRCENVRHSVYPRRQWVVKMKFEITQHQ